MSSAARTQHVRQLLRAVQLTSPAPVMQTAVAVQGESVWCDVAAPRAQPHRTPSRSCMPFLRCMLLLQPPSPARLHQTPATRPHESTRSALPGPTALSECSKQQLPCCDVSAHRGRQPRRLCRHLLFGVAQDCIDALQGLELCAGLLQQQSFSVNPEGLQLPGCLQKQQLQVGSHTACFWRESPLSIHHRLQGSD